ncbi:hypothetical protein [Massilia brevitalea]|nr:hypothetical protein [Massilia brevitalea]
MSSQRVSLTLVCLLAAGAAQAQTGVSADLGTTGIGAHLSFGFTPA